MDDKKKKFIDGIQKGFESQAFGRKVWKDDEDEEEKKRRLLKQRALMRVGSQKPPPAM